MDKPRVTPKDFFLWVGAVVALYGSTVAFISLFFDYVNHAFPDVLTYYTGDPYAGGISYEMASLIVLFPIFLLLMWLVRSAEVKDHSRREIWIRKWALMLTLFVAGAALAVDLITLIMYFLQGDVTERFLYKVILVLLIAVAGFLHFLADLRGYWNENPVRKRAVIAAVSVLVVATIASGFVIVGTPGQARMYRFDDQRVADLQDIQSQVVFYWQQKQTLPSSLADLTDPISGYTAPTDPESGLPYTYTVKGRLAFALCANFNAQTQDSSAYAPSAPTPMSAPSTPSKPGTQDNWQHGAGNVCFQRTIDPQLYAPPGKQTR